MLMSQFAWTHNLKFDSELLQWLVNLIQEFWQDVLVGHFPLHQIGEKVMNYSWVC